MCGRTHYQLAGNQDFNHCPTKSQFIFIGPTRTATDRTTEGTTTTAADKGTTKGATTTSDNVSKQELIEEEMKELGIDALAREYVWGVKIPHSVINCRDDTESKLFKKLLDTNRCIVPTMGWYEWLRKEKSNQPQPFYFAQDQVMFLGGIYNRDGYLIVTTNAGPKIEHVHHRMPVIIQAKDVQDWMDPKKSYHQVKHLINSDFKGLHHPVSKRVNDVRNNGPECINPIKLKRESQMKIDFTPPPKKIKSTGFSLDSKKKALENENSSPIRDITHLASSQSSSIVDLTEKHVLTTPAKNPKPTKPTSLPKGQTSITSFFSPAKFKPKK